MGQTGHNAHAYLLARISPHWTQVRAIAAWDAAADDDDDDEDEAEPGSCGCAEVARRGAVAGEIHAASSRSLSASLGMVGGGGSGVCLSAQSADARLGWICARTQTTDTS